jgi:group II intron reverse transcriptase/maturase
MYISGKSDGGIVLQKQTNKGAQLPGSNHTPAESVEKRPPAKGNQCHSTGTGTQCPETTWSGLARIREAAKRNPKLKFTSLMHHITIDTLREAYKALKRDAAPGVDEVTWKEYGEGIEEQLRELYDRVQNGRYRAKPSKRKWIPKGDGRQRPLGIAALEDKIVQQALLWVIQSIYEEDFLGFSYGFRPGKNPHNALDALYVAITHGTVRWVLDADIRSFFDVIDHEWLMKFVEHRIGDPRVLRLIRKFLRAGVSEDGKWSRTTVGTPQGAVISPLLANIYLHYVLDLWAHAWRKRKARSEVYIVRFADDFVMGFRYKLDANECLEAMKVRFKKFGLELHEKKTRLVEFGRFAIENRKERGEGKPETFDFLGFTHICAKRRTDGRFTIRRKTIAKKLRQKAKEVRKTIKQRRHLSLVEQGKWLRSVVRGHFNYYAVPGNCHSLERFRREVTRAWLHALKRRSQKGRNLNWIKMDRLRETWLPKARILHPYPNQRLCARPKAGAG